MCTGARWDLFSPWCFWCRCPQAARPLIGLSQIPGFGAVCRAFDPLIQVCTHLRFQVWAPRPLIEVRAHPGALSLCAHAAE